MDGPLGLLHEIASEYCTKTLTLVKEGSGADRLAVSVALFSNSDVCGRLWVDVIDLWQALHLDFYPKSGSKWFHKKKTNWTNLVTSCGFGASTVTRTLIIEHIYNRG